MHKGRVVFINGPINAGKSTIAKLLAQDDPDGAYLEGDDAFSDRGVGFLQWIDKTTETLANDACRLALEGKNVYAAWPLRNEDWDVISAACARNDISAFCITLCPAISTAMSTRTTRALDADEKHRITEMYAEGYHSRAFSHLLVDNSNDTAEATKQKIQGFLNGAECPAAT